MEILNFNKIINGRLLQKIVGVVTVSATMLLTSCDKKELCYKVHPHDALVCNTSINVSFDSSYDNSEVELASDPLHDNETYDVRYTCEAWTVNEAGNQDEQIVAFEVMGGKYVRNAVNSYTIEDVMLPAMDVKVLIWADLVKADGSEEPVFDASDLSSVKITKFGTNLGKEAFSTNYSADFAQYIYERNGIDVNVDVTLDRVYGRHKVVATDLDQFVALYGVEPSRLSVYYSFYVPKQYNCFLQSVAAATLSQSFDFVPYKDADGNLVIAEDYMLMSVGSKATSIYSIIPTVYGDSNQSLVTLGAIGMPTNINRTEVIKGSFLTKESTNVPGIDDRFDGEILVPYED